MQEEGEVLFYTVVATDTERNRIWLTIADDDEYDGYNADAILVGLDGGKWEVYLADERNSFPAQVRLESTSF